MLAGLALRWRSRPSLVESVLVQSELTPVAPPRDVPVLAAVQMAFQWHDDPAAYAEQCLALVTASSGAHLICFPEQAALPLLGLLPSAEPPGALLVQARNSPGTTVLRRRWRRAFPAIHRVYRSTFSRLARLSGAYVVAGALPVPYGSGVHLVGYVFSPDGRVVFRQPTLRAGTVGAALGQADGDTVEARSLGWSRLAILCSEDSESDDLGAAAAAGAEIVAAPVTRFHDEPLDEGNAVRRLAEAYLLYGVCACMVGAPADGLPLFAGRSGIYAPAELTTDGSGVITEALSVDREEVVLAEVDLERLRTVRRERAAVAQETPRAPERDAVADGDGVAGAPG